MRVATWNVNSVKQRHGRLLEWLDSRRPDVVCLQELKLTDDAFATLIGPDLEERGYEFATAGQPQWNGSALLSKVGLEDVVVGIPGAPAFDGIVEGRAISGVCDGIRVHSLYTPNGREIGSDHYDYKLEWLANLAEQGRADDNEETIRTRLGVYRDETAPLIQHYGDQIISIDAVGDVDEINQRAMEALGK